MLIGFFPMAMILAWLFEVSPDGWIRTTSRKSTENPYRPSKKKPFTSLGIMLTLVIVMAFQYLFVKYFNNDGESRKSIAVLNLVDQSDEKKDVYFADAVTNDIIDRLCLIRELRVISPYSSRTYKDSEASILTIATELDVASILSGTVRRKGEITSISVRLTDGLSTVLWSHTYEIKSSRILDIHADIAIQISRNLDIELDDLELELLNRQPTMNLTAWDYYQKGIRLYTYHLTDSIDLAIEQFKKAISLDSNYSLAWSGLADAYSQLHFRAARGIHWLDSSRVSAKRALQLDTNSAEAYKALSNPYFYLKRYDTAFILLKKAVEKNPKNASCTYNLGSVHLVWADLVNALRLMKRAASMNPRHPVPFQAIGWTYRLLGNMPEAQLWLNSSLDRNNGLWETYRELGFTYCFDGNYQMALDLAPKMLELGKRDARTLEIAGRIALFAGDKKSAKAYFHESIEKNPNYSSDAYSHCSIGLGAIFLNEGDKIQAEVYLTQALNQNLEQIEKGVEDDDPPYNAAAIYAIQGKKEESLRWLSKAIEYHWIDYNQVEKGPYFVKLAGDPDLAQMLKGVRSRIDSMRMSIPTN
jgi:TolB-like protein/Tfp pilus assembly protein PilF